MLNLVILATTLWVCPGEVYSNEPREGCKPFHQSSQGGFSTTPNPKQGPATQQPPQGAFPAGPSGTSPVIIEQGRPAASPETCALWKEWQSLYTKTDRGGLNAPELSTDEFERWEKIRYLFTPFNPPNCP